MVKRRRPGGAAVSFGGRNKGQTTVFIRPDVIHAGHLKTVVCPLFLSRATVVVGWT